MTLLLDTHVVLWWLAGDARLSGAARDAIAGEGDILVSTASAWEMAIKAGLGQLKFPADLGGFLAAQLQANGFEVLPIGLRHAAAVRDLPRHHQDLVRPPARDTGRLVQGCHAVRDVLDAKLWVLSGSV